MVIQGVRTVIVSDALLSEEQARDAAAHGETWLFYPNDLPKRSAYSGDTRWALAPFLAHQALSNDSFSKSTGSSNSGSYKWVLHSSADTVLLPEAVRQMLAGFDEVLPYIITDNLWWGDQHGGPVRDAPRCLPCHFDDNHWQQMLSLTQGTSAYP